MRMRDCMAALAVTVLIAGCGSAERKVNKAEAEVNKERLSLVEDYTKCIDKAGSDKAKVESCDSYLKAAEALQ